MNIGILVWMHDLPADGEKKKKKKKKKKTNKKKCKFKSCEKTIKNYENMKSINRGKRKYMYKTKKWAFMYENRSCHISTQRRLGGPKW